jgi:hypothetical protein
MNRCNFKRCAEYAVLLAALATGSYLTTFFPTPHPETADAPGAASTLNHASTHDATQDLTGIDVDMRRLSLFANLC